MHEASIARRIVELVLDRAAGERVARVTGWIAEDEALSPESLDFHFRAHARGTAAEGAALALELRHVPAHCRGCGASFAPEHHLHLCPACGSGDVELSGPTGLSIESITLA